jgi:hypothetical protein
VKTPTEQNYDALKSPIKRPDFCRECFDGRFGIVSSYFWVFTQSLEFGNEELEQRRRQTLGRRSAASLPEKRACLSRLSG